MKKVFLSFFLATSMLVSSLQYPMLKAYAEENPITSAITSAITSPITSAIIDIINPNQNSTPVSQSQGGNTNGNSSSNNSSETPNKPTACNAEKPKGAPKLLKVQSIKNNAVTVFWTKPQGPVNSYIIAYGKKPGLMEYATGIINGENAASYTIRNLVKGTNYYFRVKGLNNCMSGEFSNEVSIRSNNTLIKRGNPIVVEEVVASEKEKIVIEKVKKQTTNNNPTSGIIEKLFSIFFNR